MAITVGCPLGTNGTNGSNGWDLPTDKKLGPSENWRSLTSTSKMSLGVDMFFCSLKMMKDSVTAWYSMVQHGTAWYSMVQHGNSPCLFRSAPAKVYYMTSWHRVSHPNCCSAICSGFDWQEQVEACKGTWDSSLPGDFENFKHRPIKKYPIPKKYPEIMSRVTVTVKSVESAVDIQSIATLSIPQICNTLLGSH